MALTGLTPSPVICNFPPINNSFATVPAIHAQPSSTAPAVRRAEIESPRRAGSRVGAFRAVGYPHSPPTHPRRLQPDTLLPTDASISQVQPTGQRCWWPSLRLRRSVWRKRQIWPAAQDRMSSRRGSATEGSTSMSSMLAGSRVRLCPLLQVRHCRRVEYDCE